MTRLVAKWIDNMEAQMELYNRELKRKTGLDLTELMKASCNLKSEDISNAQIKLKVSVVPITQGMGLISKFSESVAAIIRTAGFNVSVTENTDVNGMHEAISSGADILFMADDDRYLALNIKTGAIGDNNYCTSLGFIEVMFQMAKKNGRVIEKNDILMLGYGILGKEAYSILKGKGYKPKVYDKHLQVNKEIEVIVKENIKNYSYILDFTNEGDWINTDMLKDDVLYASPGIPVSLNEEAIAHNKENSVFDLLEIGTVIMLASVI
ncbi:MAG: 3-methylornithyl-N6-L-lysine dehydrogenase PylD [Peptostreptococcaceae bacterium]|nr:3-methylornithyl-N6-L-lysine dehydrogenase PylD [Peptostreptococcaceae bacterium]